MKAGITTVMWFDPSKDPANAGIADAAIRDVRGDRPDVLLTPAFAPRGRDGMVFLTSERGEKNLRISARAEAASHVEEAVAIPARRQRVASALIAAALCMPVAGCAVLNGTAPEEAPPSASRVELQARIPAPATVSAGVCLDGSLSSVPSFSSTEQSRLQQAIGQWSPDTPVTAEGAPPRPGLQLSVRQVLTNSYSSSAGSLTLEIPAVPGLVARPNVSDAGFVEADRQWQSGKKRYEADSAAAAAAATQAATALEHYQLERQNSEISGCLSALAQTLTGSSRRLILVSDLEQTEQPQISGDMSGTSILIVQACGGSAATCTNLAGAWTSQLKSRGTSAVRILRPESSSPTVYTSFLTGVLT